MGMRVDALLRVFALLWVYTVGALISTVVFFIGLLWMIADVVWQLIVGSDGLSSTSTPANWVKGTFMWIAGQTNYALTGSGDLMLLPSPA